MEPEPDAPSEKKPDVTALDSAPGASGHPASASGATSTREASAASSLASRDGPPDSIKASSGLSPRHSSARSPTPVATAAVPAAAPGPRRSPLSAASGRRPLPGSAPSQSASSASPTSAQPARDAPMSKTSASATISPKEKMTEPEKGGMDKVDSQNRTNLPLGGPSSIAVRVSSTSSSCIPANILEDEIVVGTKPNGKHSSPIHVVSDQEDIEMEDRDHSPEPSHPKRKRSSVYNELEGERIEQSLIQDDIKDVPTITSALVVDKAPRPMPQPSMTTQRSITLGYWRDSAVPDENEKHAVVGFIDTRDRLRTRIQQSSRSGKFVAADYPLPPGPGGSWVTFERVVFDKHLVGLDHNQVKEYVKIRSENSMAHNSPEEELENEKVAVKEAIRRAALHPTPDNMPAPAIAYGVDLPDYVVNAARPEKKRRMISNGTFGAFSSAADIAANSPSAQQSLAPAGGSPSVASAIQRSAIDLLPGTRPTKILLGYWRGSSEERVEDKHAVFGILGANDMFRVKVTRETRDGRPVMGNFPTGAGALWIHYDEVEFEKHIRHLSRPEVKEYVRVRQRQIDEGEKPDQRIENETKAVYDAQARVISAGGVAQSTLGTAGRVDTISFASAANLNHRQADNGSSEIPSHYQQDGRTRREYEPRQTRRSYAADSRDSPASIAAAAIAATPPLSRSGRHSLPDGVGMTTELRPANRPPPAGHGAVEGSKALPNCHNGSGPNADRVERTNSLARREIVRVESIQMRNEQRAANRETGLVGSGGSTASGMSLAGEPTTSVLASLSLNGNAGNGSGVGSSAGNNGGSSRQTFSENIGRLNKVWASQEATRLRAGGEDAKIYMGVKYERKQTGPFQGKLVSPGTILSIDGEDYVEYRVLTKPTFF
ncbi:hypothetical protein CMQ_7942 [Grosmannia clavigera kw1407]|uniref:tRNA splicing endonuclease subunit n=1 Tax=Grosmannia clavigera (strain kw1407 / UAMH 11150) TaxID=655863 RepID=F0XRR2_GROCL|nr:uncharacterized protein CMQ_7942 [Grosmannia clavigera kw1407]EFW99574.1 hypothetical protein CMQ_7942 [Grosmannia clavigera kw1407]